MIPTITTGDEYARMLDLVEHDRLPAAIPVDFQGNDGLWTESFNPCNVDFSDEDAPLFAAIVAIRSAYRSARRAGAITRV